jgi:basic membrane protein A
MKKAIMSIMSLFMVTTLFAGCTKQETATISVAGSSKKEIKVGFIYVGPPGDGGYTYQHDQGRKYLEEQLKVKTITKENVKEDKSEVRKVIDGMVDEGANVIFSTSFGFMDGTEEAAKAYPNVKFLHASGYKSNTTNFVNYFGRIEEPRYLAGMVAGLKTKTNKIGFVSAFEIPECVRGINAFTLGVQAVNPNAKVIVKWAHTWYDPAIEKQAALALLDQGADVLTQHLDSPAVQQAAEEKGAFSVGYNSNMEDKAPKAYMTSAVWNWGPYYVDQVKKIQDGTWKAENYWGHMKDGVVDIAPLTANAPAGAKEKVEKAKADILSGKLNVFAGPIKDQAGKERVASGKALTDEEQLSMDWFVDGVQGSPKAN